MTKRSFLLGLGLAVWANLWIPYSNLIVRSSRADYAHLSVAFLVPFICLLGINLLLERRGRGLSPSELLTTCCIGMVAGNVQGEWLADYLLSTVTQPLYFASAENRWEEFLLPHIPAWTIVSDRGAIVGFYESLPEGADLPWRPWIVPAFWWGGFLGAVLLANVCTAVILRKQWMENERLAFPIATGLLALTGVSGSQGTLSTLLRSRLFQAGVGLVLGGMAWNILSWFFASVPELPHLFLRGEGILTAKGFPSFVLKVHPMSMAFAYFCKSEVLVSIWLFHLLAMLQVGIQNRIGFDIGGPDPWCSFDAAIGWQSFGGMIVFVGWGLWIARSHIASVCRKAFTKTDKVDDSGELLSYRTAVWLLIGCAVYISLWLHRAGMAWGPFLAFGFSTLVLYVGLARIIVESGLIYLRGPITAQAFTWHLFGIAGMGPASAAVLGGLTYTFFCDAKTFAMTTLAHIPRLGAAMSVRYRRALVPAILLGAAIGTATVVTFTLHQGYYTVGSYNFGGGSYDGIGGIWPLTARRIQQGFGTDWNRVKFLCLGGVFTALLFFLRTRFPAFPIHPIGFTISASGTMRSSISSIFLVWLIRTLLVKVGGLDRYRQTAPFFLGMLIGFLAGIGLGVLVDVIWFHGNGHRLNTW